MNFLRYIMSLSLVAVGRGIVFRSMTPIYLPSCPRGIWRIGGKPRVEPPPLDGMISGVLFGNSWRITHHSRVYASLVASQCPYLLMLRLLRFAVRALTAAGKDPCGNTIMDSAPRKCACDSIPHQWSTRSKRRAADGLVAVYQFQRACVLSLLAVLFTEARASPAIIEVFMKPGILDFLR